MKIIIFAGGSGRRLWPLSRKASPKQFEPIIGDKSTLRLAVDRVAPKYGAKNIFISTNERYVDMIRKQLPELPPENVIGEPTRRDLAAAVGLAMAHLAHAIPEEVVENEPVAILWGDNYMDQVDVFRRVLEAAEKLIADDKAKIIFMGETPRFANDQLGWIGLGEEKGEVNGRSYYGFKSLRYRPPLEECKKMFAEKTHVWNTGYFVTTIGFVRKQYQQQQPAMWAGLKEIEETIGQPNYEETLQRVYPNFEVISFDDAILHHIKPDDALVLHGEMGWSDPGTLYALKEAINPDPDANVTRGKVITEQSTDSLIFNYEDEKLVTVIVLDGMIVVHTEDAILVVHKDNIPLVKKVVNDLEGTDLEAYS